MNHLKGKLIQTMVSEPFPEHKYRCDTCAYFKECSTDFILLSSHFSHDPSTISSFQGLFMTLMALKGCMSHSSPSPDQIIRERIIDEAIDAIENQKDHKEFLLSRFQKDIVEDILDGIRKKDD